MFFDAENNVRRRKTCPGVEENVFDVETKMFVAFFLRSSEARASTFQKKNNASASNEYFFATAQFAGIGFP